MPPQRILRPILRPVMWLAAAGLVASLAVHALALSGISSPLGKLTFLLHLGVFVVWIPVVLVANRITRVHARKDYWRVLLRNCPSWMRVMSYAFFGYAFVNFALVFIWPAATGSGAAIESAPATSPDVLRGFSGHWMVFYSMAFAVSYSVTRVPARHCPAGHAVGPVDNYCISCGQPVIDTPTDSRYGSGSRPWNS